MHPLYGDLSSYAVVKTNHRKMRNETVTIIRGRAVGFSLAEFYRNHLTEKEKAEGWSFHAEHTVEPPTFSAKPLAPAKRQFLH
jgi:hypothetical protein